MAQTLSGTPRPGRDWTTETTDRIEAVVEVVRDKTTVPVTKAARAVVYGLVAALLAILALILLIIGVFRLHVYLPFHPEGRRVYVAYFIVGAIFLGSGGLLWHMRSPKTKDSR